MCEEKETDEAERERRERREDGSINERTTLPTRRAKASSSGTL